MTVANGVSPIQLHDGLCWCVILQAMDPEVVREMEKALEGNMRLEKLRLVSFETLPKEFYRHVLSGTRRSTSLSHVHLRFNPQTWHCPDNGTLVCQYCVTQLDVVYSV